MVATMLLTSLSLICQHLHPPKLAAPSLQMIKTVMMMGLSLLTIPWSFVCVLSSSQDQYIKIPLEKIQKDWDAPIYVFFLPTTTIEYIEGRKAHVFQCAASRCHCKTRYVCRFLDTKDAKSTSNLRHHAKLCWGDDTVAAADDTCDVKTAREALSKRKDLNRSITAAFERAGKGKVTYSHH